MTDEAQWVRETFDLVRNGGIWVVPRSGLTFRKGIMGMDTLTLVSRGSCPLDETPFNDELWADYQEADFLLIKRHTEDAGIEVFDQTDGVITDADL